MVEPSYGPCRFLVDRYPGLHEHYRSRGRATRAKRFFYPMSADDSTLDRFRRLCLDLPETVETGSWGHPNFRAGKRTFAAFEWITDRPCVAVRLGADEIESLLLQHKDFFATPYGRGRWVSAWADVSIDWALWAALLERAYRQVALQRMINALDDARRNAE